MFAIVTIPGRNPRALLKERVPKWVRWFFPLFLILSTGSGAIRIFLASRRPGFPTQASPGLPGPFETIFGSAVCLGALYAAYIARKAASMKTCPNGHLVPMGAAHCSECGHQFSDNERQKAIR